MYISTKKLIFIFAFFSVSPLLVYYYFSDKETKLVESEYISKIEYLKTKLDKLQAKVSDLEEDKKILSLTLAAESQDRSVYQVTSRASLEVDSYKEKPAEFLISENNDNLSEIVSSDLTVEEVQSFMEIQQRSREFNDWYSKKTDETPGFDLRVELSSSFEREKVDYEWAESQEQNINSLFYENPKLSAYSLIESSCKSTQCRVVVAVDSIENSNELSLQFGSLMQKNNPSGLYSVTGAVDKDAGNVILFVARQDG